MTEQEVTTGSKGQQTQQSQQSQSYTPSAATGAAATQALTAAQTAAASPFNLPTQQYAGFNPTQQAAFSQLNSLQGAAQPYYNQAQTDINASAQPLTQSQIQNYYNPMASQVLGQLSNQQGQQMQQVTGNATQQAGGVDASRIGVAQSELANQQSLAYGQTAAGLEQSALTAAQQQQQNQANAGYALGNLGTTVQGAGLQYNQALQGAGTQQQNLSQNQLNAQYQNQLAQQSYQFQTPQYLASIASGLNGTLGGTTTGNLNSVTTPAQPSIYSQIIGAGTAAAGIAGAFANRGGRVSEKAGGGATSTSTGYNILAGDPIVPMNSLTASAPPQMQQMQIQPLINPNANTPNLQSMAKMGTGIGNALSNTSVGDSLQDAIQDAGDKRGGRIMASGGMVNPMASPYYDDGGGVTDEQRALGYEMLRQGMGTQAPASIPGGEPAPPNAVINPDNPYRLNGTDQPVQGDPSNMPSGIPSNAPSVVQNDVGGPGGAPPDAAAAIQRSMHLNGDGMQGTAMGYAGAPNTNPIANPTTATADLPYSDIDPKTDKSRAFAKSPWLALINAGLGIMGGTSPWAGVNIGKGLQQGVQTLEQQRKDLESEEGVNQRAKQLAQQAQNHLDLYNKVPLKDQQQMDIEKEKLKLQRDQLEEQGWKQTYDLTTGKPVFVNPRTKKAITLDADGKFVPIDYSHTNVTPSVPSPEGIPKVPTPDGAKPVAAALPQPGQGAYHPPTAPASEAESGPTYLPNGQLRPELRAETVRVQKEAGAAAATASDMKYQLGLMKQEFQNIDKTAGAEGYFLQPGAWADTRFAIAKGLNAMFGGTLVDPKDIGSAEAINKITVRLGQAQARLLGAREAAQVVQQSIKANPGLETTTVGRQNLIAGMEMAAQRQLDYAKYVQQYMAGPGRGSASGAEEAFARDNPPEKYVAAAHESVLPPQAKATLPQAVQVLRAHADNPAAIAKFNEEYNGLADFYLGKH